MSPDLRAHLDALGQAVSDAPPAELPDLLGERERLRAGAWMRATAPPPTSRTESGGDRNVAVSEAARRLGVSADWLYKNAFRLPFTVRIGRRLLFSSQGLERWNRQRQGR